MATNTGGPAFPTLQSGRTQSGEICHNDVGGLSVRDYFAAKAMAALVCNPNSKTGANDLDGAAKSVAGWSYIIADAMLSAREAKP